MSEIRIPARPEPLSIDPAETALVVIDMQNGFLSKGGYLDLIGTDVSAAPKVIDAVRSVLDAARKAGLKVVYFQNGFEADLRELDTPGSPLYHKSAALRYMRTHPEARGKLVTRGSWDFEFVEGIKPLPGELVVNKARYSGFAGTHFDQWLRASRIRTLVFIGVNTNVCVESTLRDAYHHEYFCLLVADATFQSGPQSMMDATVFNVERFFGWVATTKDVCDALNKAAAQT